MQEEDIIEGMTQKGGQGRNDAGGRHYRREE